MKRAHSLAPHLRRLALPILALASSAALMSCSSISTGTPDISSGIGLPKLSSAWPLHFCSANVESRYPTSQAIPNRGAITSAGGAVQIYAHPDNTGAQLRMIDFPRSMHASKSAARALANSGAIQNGDILVVFRKEWAKVNAYGNVQLGQGHAALATIDTDSRGTIVHTVESPLSYSSNLTSSHYRGHKTFQVIRPTLSSTQRANVAAWARKVLDRNKVSFFDNYGAPYYARKSGRPINVSTDLAMNTLYGDGSVGVYCSELVWALLGLRDVSPDAVLAKYPSSTSAAKRYVSGKAKPFYNPLPGVTRNPLSSPGLMQGPDVVLRQIMSTQDRRDHMVNVALTPRNGSGTMSSGHRETAKAFGPKIEQFRQWYGKGEPSSEISALNQGLVPNYSPTSFTILANSNRGILKYVGTVTFE